MSPGMRSLVADGGRWFTVAECGVVEVGAVLMDGDRTVRSGSAVEARSFPSRSFPSRSVPSSSGLWDEVVGGDQEVVVEGRHVLVEDGPRALTDAIGGSG